MIAPATAAVRDRGPAAQRPKAMVGRVTGTLSDAATGELLVGGQVAVQGYPLGNVSDDAGVYFINNVPVGKRTLAVEYLGYEPQSREHTVLGGNGNTVDFAMSSTPITMDEVLVEEVTVRDLSDHVARASAPSFGLVSPRRMEIEKPDTTLMEDWHGGWRNYSALYSIEYPMMGESVYFRRPVKARAGRPQAGSAPEALPAAAPERRSP